MKRMASYAVASLMLFACGTGGPDSGTAVVDSTAASASSPAASGGVPEDVGAGDADSGEASAPSTSPTTDEPASTTVTTPVAGEGVVPAAIMDVLLADAAERSGVSVDELTVERAEAVEWSDASLGCPEPGMSYAQVVTSGFWVVIAAGETSYDYRVLDNGQYRLCDDGETGRLVVPDPPSKDPIDPPPGDD